MSRAITSEREYQDHKYPMAVAYYKILVVALVQAGYSATRYKVLEPTCFPSQETVTECRKSQWVKLYLDAIQSGVDLETLPDINSCDFLTNLDLELTGTYASYETALTGTNNDLKFTSKFIGLIGNDFSVSYVDPAANSQALSVTVVGNHIKVNLATGGGGAITSTASLILAAINAHATAKLLVLATLKSGNDGTGIVTAMAITHLSGGME